MATTSGSTEKTKCREKRSFSSEGCHTDMEELIDSSSSLDLEFGIRDEKKELRKRIEKVYDNLLAFLSREEYDAELRKELSNNYSIKDKGLDKENYEIILKARKEDIQRMECGIPISGETSSGKSSLINKLVGQELFCPKARAATAKICRIRPSNSKEVYLKLSDADDNVIDDKLRGIDDLEEIRKCLEENSDLKKSVNADQRVHYIDVFCPFGNLQSQKNMMLVDTPGIGTSEDLTNMLFRYLPSAIAFVFIINVSNAGGVQHDRILKILKTILTNIYEMPCFDQKDVLFVTNKWNMLRDQMREDSDDEIQETWDDVKTDIKKIWPVFEEDTIFKLYLKTINPEDGSDEERADFERFTKRLLDLSRKNMDSKIGIHLRLLKDDMNRIRRGINARINTISKDDRKRYELEKSYNEMKTIQGRCPVVKKDLLAEITTIVSILSENFHTTLMSSNSSDEIQDKCHTEEKESIDWKSIMRRETMEWMKGEEVLNALDSIEKFVSKKFKEMHPKIVESIMLLTGEEDIDEKNYISSDLQKLLEPCPWLPTMNTFAALDLFPDETQHSSHVAVVSHESYASISDCLELYTKEVIETSLKFIFDMHFETRINGIFDKALPREIGSIIATIEHVLLAKSFRANEMELKKWLGLKGDLFDIYEEVDGLLASS